MESHLLQMRGLKQFCRTGKQIPVQVASFTDAWIETACGSQCHYESGRRIFYRCVD